jgi:hypothetical protein
MTEFASRIEQINEQYGLEIDLGYVEEIYGEDMLQSMADMAEEVSENIDYLVELGFDEGVSDICNRFAPILLEDNGYFREKVDRLIADLGHDAIEKLCQDMTPWEELM